MRRRRTMRPMREEGGPAINEAIRAPRVIVLDEEGARLGEFLTADAVQMARDHGLDLVVVGAQEQPPICKMADYGKLKYQRQKKQRATRSTSSQMKEIKVRPKTGDHDLDVKISKVRKFLDAGNRVTITVWFRGREHAHRDIGVDQCMRVASAVDDVSRIESRPTMFGRQMRMVLSPA